MVQEINKSPIDISNVAARLSNNNSKLQGYFSSTGFLYKLVNLVCLSFLGFGSCFCFDNPAALTDAFHNDLKMSTENYFLLYSIYSWPNIIFCFFGGLLVDKVFGIRWGTIIYLALTIFGHLVFATGAYHNIFWMMILGRFIFGVGSESLAVAQNSYTVHCFQKKEMNLFFGLEMSFSKAGSTVNFLVMRHIYEYVSHTLGLVGPHCIGISLLVAALSFVTSILSASLIVSMDKHAEKVMNRTEIKKCEIPELNDIMNFKLQFWLVVFVTLLYYGTVYPFISLGKDFLIRKYEFEAAAANTANSLVYSIRALASPVFGIFIDKTGNNVLWLIVGVTGSFLAHGFLAFTYVNPYVCLIILGLSFAIFASSMWPFIPLVVPQQNLGTAYGLIEASLNLNRAVTFIVSGMIITRYGYFLLEIFFFLLLWISLIIGILMWKLSQSHSQKLD